MIVAGTAAVLLSLSAVQIASPDAQAATNPQGVFRIKCDYSHSLADDPIVKFKQPGASHLHDFFGNATTNAFSTPAKLKLGSTTCMNPLDKSGYWAPSLSVDGVTVQPRSVTVYYDNDGKPLASIMAPPANLRIVAGDAHATAAQGLSVTSWDCGANDPTPDAAEPPTCPGGVLVLHVKFPDCWDGLNRDSVDHKSHMAYSTKQACPSTHPVPVARLRLNVRYATEGGAGVALSSGGVYSGHADFFNIWNMKELRRLVKTCIRAGLTPMDPRCDQDPTNG